jgi:glycosyltransferase involved in cell wall biosynthesis
MASMPIVVSIVICTRNRAESLRETLISLAGCVVPPDAPAEILVVDNGSSDQTRQVTASAPSTGRSIRYVSEPRKGQCFARNAGLRNSRGSVILFTDDDVRVPPDWIEKMARPVLLGQADVVAGGIKIAPQLTRPWQTDHHRNWLAGYQGPKPGQELWVIGANMGFSRKVLERVPSFDEELGPGQLGFGDDALFGKQAAAAGFRTVFVPGAEVEHHFDPSRLSRQSLLNASLAYGRSNAYLHHHWSHGNVPLARLKICQLPVLLMWHRIRNGKPADEGISQFEMGTRSYLEYCKAFLAHRRRPRNYEHHGLVKLTHTGASKLPPREIAAVSFHGT